MSDVTIQIGNGNLGRAGEILDGVCALIGHGVSVTDQFALGDILKFTNLKEAEAKGITADYDETNLVLLWHHIRDFFKNAGDGAELYVMPVAKTVTMTDMADLEELHAHVMLEKLGGRVRMLAITSMPFENETSSDQFPDDLWDAIDKAQALYAHQLGKHRPIQIFIEGRGFAGGVANARYLTHASQGPMANRVNVVILQDYYTGQINTPMEKYAAVCIAMGRAAAIPVQRSIGRVKDGPIVIDGPPGLSNGALLSTFSESDLEVLAIKGYIVLRQYDGKAGYYLSGDPNAVVKTDDYAYIHLSRPIDKAVRICYETYVNELQDDIFVDPITGKLPASVVKGFQRQIEKAILLQMKDEISGVTAFIDANQNILSTDNLEIVLKIVPKGMIGAITVKLSYSNPLNA